LLNISTTAMPSIQSILGGRSKLARLHQSRCSECFAEHRAHRMVAASQI